MAIIQIVQWNGHLVWLSMWHYVKQLSYLYKNCKELGILKQIDSVWIYSVKMLQLSYYYLKS